MSRTVLASLMLAASLSGSPAFAERSFIVPANDGYGVADCLADGSACGRIVADAWCQSQGLNVAASFGPTDPVDVTASISASVQPAAKTYTITCKD